MKKKFLYFLVLLISIFFIKISTSKTPEPEGFEEFMKNIDMDQLLKDMEEVFGPINEKTESKETPQIPIKKTMNINTIKDENPETSFKKSLVIPTDKSSEKINKLAKEKRDTLIFYMDDFTKKLDSL